MIDLVAVTEQGAAIEPEVEPGPVGDSLAVFQRAVAAQVIGQSGAKREEVLIGIAALGAAIAEIVVKALEARAHHRRELGLDAKAGDPAGVVAATAVAGALAGAACAASTARTARAATGGPSAISAIAAVAAASADTQGIVVVIAGEGHAARAVEQIASRCPAQPGADASEIIVEIVAGAVIAFEAEDALAILPVVADVMAADQTVTIAADGRAQARAVTAAPTATATAASIVCAGHPIAAIAAAAASTGTRIATGTCDEPAAAVAAAAADAATSAPSTTDTRVSVGGVAAGTPAAAAAATAAAAAAAIHRCAASVIVAEAGAEMPAGIEARPILGLGNGRAVEVNRMRRRAAKRGDHHREQGCAISQMFHRQGPLKTAGGQQITELADETMPALT